MNLRITYYVVALAISLAAFAGAYGYATARGEVAAARAANAKGANYAVSKADREVDGAWEYSNVYILNTTPRGTQARTELAEARTRAAADLADAAVADAPAAAALAAVPAYGMAASVALAAFAGAFILDKRRDA